MRRQKQNQPHRNRTVRLVFLIISFEESFILRPAE